MASDNNKRIANNTLYLFIRMFIVLGVGFFTSRIILNTLGVEDYGIYNVVGGVVVLFAFLQHALHNATYRYLAYGIGENDSIKLRKTFSMALNAHVILAIIMIVLCESFGVWFLNTHLVIPEDRLYAANIVFQLSLLCFCIGIIRTPYDSAIIAHEKMNFYALTSIIEVVLKLLFVYSLVIFPFDKLILFAVLLFFVSIIMLLWYYIRCKQLFAECSYMWCWDATLIKSIASYSGWSLMVNIIDVLNSQSIAFFFNVFFGVVTNAALGVANQVNGHLSRFLGNFTQSYNPQIIKSYASDDKRYFMKLIFSASKFSYYLMFIVAVPILINIEYILNIWLGTPPPGSGLFIILVVVLSLTDAYSAPLWIGVHATGRLKTHQILMSSIKILNIPIAYMILKFGGAAWTIILLQVITNIICSIVRPIYVHKLYDLPVKEYFLKVFGVIYLVTFLSLPLSLYISCQYEEGLLKVLLTSVSFIVVAFPVIYKIGLNDNERDVLKNTIVSKLSFLKRW